MMYLNHTKLELRKMSKPALVKIGHAILKRLPKSTLVNTVHKLEQLAKSKGIKSIGKIARKVGRKARKVGVKAKRKFKRARSARTRLDNGRYRSVVPGRRVGRKYKKYTMTKKRRGGKNLHFTKKGQPYILLASGKARFVKR